MSVLFFPDGNYRYVKGVFQYSAGVAAEPGFEIERVRFAAPLSLIDGVNAIKDHLDDLNRPLTALCACELRSPRPMSEGGFAEFNRQYVEHLVRLKIFRDGLNPIARTNVCPEINAPSEPCLYAFSYTVPARNGRETFIVAGSGEAPEGKSNYRDHIICPGDHSTMGLRTKARWVLGEMERRMSALGFGWANATGMHLYTVHDVHPFLAEEIISRTNPQSGLSWHFARPPVCELDYEMDVRAVSCERIM
jgi:hypothetical protein